MEKISSSQLNNNFNQNAGRQKLDILGVLIDNLTLSHATNQILKWVDERRQDPAQPYRHVVTVNPEYVMAARKDKAFRELLTAADMVTADGVGIMLAGRILGTRFKQRVTGVALAENIFKAAAQHSLRLFLLGAGPGVAEEAAAVLQKQYPGINIVGTWAGQAAPEGDNESLERIRQAGAEIVLVAYGMLKQDWWIARNLAMSGATVAIGIGGVLDYKAGRVALAPLWVRKAGLEWLFRLYKEPWRWRRQLALPRFVAAVLLSLLSRQLKNSNPKKKKS